MNALRILSLLLLCTLLGAGLSACAPDASPTAVETLAVPSPEPSPTPQPRTLVVCMGQEPDTLYLLGNDTTLAANHIRQAIYDGPIDMKSFGYQPVILEKLPSLADGDAVIRTVEVKAGDLVVDSAGDPIELSTAIAVPVRLRPAGCHDAACAVDWLPVSGTIAMEQMVVTFTLKPGLAWADGTPLTVYDSQYTYDLSLDPDTPTPSPWVPGPLSYVAVDERTIVWTGRPGYRDSMYMTNFWTPLPKHQLGQMTAAEIVKSEEAARRPLGYGPFTVQEWVAGDHITVVRNPYYFRASEGLPHFDQVIFRFMGENVEAALAALLTGECDILTQDNSLESAAGQMIAFETKGRMKMAFAVGTAFEHLDFGLDPVESYQRPDFFGDVRMRQAIAMCLNRQQVVDKLLYGRSQVIASYIPPSHPLYNTDLQPLPYDPVAGRALLEQMGWWDIDGDGYREAHRAAGFPDGTELTFHWSSTSAALRNAYMRMFQADLADCGIHVILDNLPAADFFAAPPTGPLEGRHFDLASFTWLTDVEPPCELYMSSQIPTAENGWAGQNYIGYANPEFDAACQAALQALPGTPEYERYHKEAQRIFARDLPSLPLYMRLKIAATRPEVTGLILDPTAGSELWNIEEFDKNP